ncbi:uncharacterized protein LOC144097658 [Amblyomma americanum]
MSEMLLFRLVLATSGFVLMTPLVSALPYLHSARRAEASREVTSTLFDAVSLPEGEDVTEQGNELISSYGLLSETSLSGPGSKCNQSSRCVAALICTVSGTCACPESSPVLLRDRNSFACVLLLDDAS